MPQPMPPIMQQILPRPRPGTNDHLAQSVRAIHPLGQTNSDRKRLLTDIRNQLPIAEYLNVLHLLAITGMVPEYDPPAQPGELPLPNGKFSPADRVLQQKTLTYLIDKAMAPIEKPAASAIGEVVDDDAGASDALSEPNGLSLERARNLTVGQLVRALRSSIHAQHAYQAASPATATPVPAQARVDHHAPADER